MAAKQNKAFKAGKNAAKKAREEARKNKSIKSFNLPDDLYQRFKKECAGQEVSMSSVIEEMIKGYLDEQ